MSQIAHPLFLLFHRFAVLQHCVMHFRISTRLSTSFLAVFLSLFPTLFVLLLCNLSYKEEVSGVLLSRSSLDLSSDFASDSLSSLWPAREDKSVTKSRGVFHFQKLSENFYWEFPFGKSTSPISSQAPLCHFTKWPDALVNCSAIFLNMSFVAFLPNKCLSLAFLVMRSVSSASSHLSQETCTSKNIFKQSRISSYMYHFYMQHIVLQWIF